MSETTSKSGKPIKLFHGGGLELDNNFKEWWSQARKSEEPPTPLEFLTNFGISPQSGSMMEMFWELVLGFIPEYGYRSVNRPAPGQLDYFAYYLKDAFKRHPTGYWNLKWLKGFLYDREDSDSEDQDSEDRNDEPPPVVQCALDAIGFGLTEEDVKSLIGIISPSDDDLTLCIEGNYSLDLVNSFLGRKSAVDHLSLTLLDREEDNARETDRTVIDGGLLSVVQKHIKKIESIKFGGVTDDGADTPWTKDAFLRCLRMMIQSECPSTFELMVPEKFVDEENTMNSFPDWPDQKIVSSIEDLTVYLSLMENKAANQAVIDLIPHMARLRSLDISLSRHDYKMAAPYLSQLLKSANFLEDMFIDTYDANVFPGDQGRDLLDVLETLKTNTSLVRFHYDGIDKIELSCYERTLLDILKLFNATLQHVELGIDDYPDSIFKKSVRKQMDYYLLLNQHGRQRARDPELQLVDFVALLGDVNRKMAAGVPVAEKLDHKKALNALFGLLQEQPGFWSKASSLADVSKKSRKRKRSNPGWRKQLLSKR